jgi:hypothetical protein
MQKIFQQNIIYILSLIIIVMSVNRAYSEEKFGSISGEVRDAVTKQPLPAANAMLVGTNSGASTNDNGYFVIKNIPIGVYQLKVSYIGYNNFINDDVQVVLNRNTNM